MNKKVIGIMNNICKDYHKSRTEALEILISIEDNIKYREIHKGRADFNSSYFYLSLGHLQNYYREYNKGNGSVYK